jgi:2-haloacid dehalogenase
MMAGTIEKTVDILAQLRAKNIPLYALTNFSAETFPIAERRFDFLTWFNGIVVSGYEKLAKPDPRIFEILLKRYELIPADTLYIDDNALNIATAQTLGFNTIHFTAPESLADELRSLHLLPLQRYAQ